MGVVSPFLFGPIGPMTKVPETESQLGAVSPWSRVRLGRLPPVVMSAASRGRIFMSARLAHLHGTCQMGAASLNFGQPGRSLQLSFGGLVWAARGRRGSGHGSFSFPSSFLLRLEPHRHLSLCAPGGKLRWKRWSCRGAGVGLVSAAGVLDPDPFRGRKKDTETVS